MAFPESLLHSTLFFFISQRYIPLIIVTIFLILFFIWLPLSAQIMLNRKIREMKIKALKDLEDAKKLSFIWDDKVLNKTAEKLLFAYREALRTKDLTSIKSLILPEKYNKNLKYMELDRENWVIIPLEIKVLKFTPIFVKNVNWGTWSMFTMELECEKKLLSKDKLNIKNLLMKEYYSFIRIEDKWLLLENHLGLEYYNMSDILPQKYKKFLKERD